MPNLPQGVPANQEKFGIVQKVIKIFWFCLVSKRTILLRP